MRIEPVGSTSWRVRQPEVAGPVVPVRATSLQPHASTPQDAARWLATDDRRRRRRLADDQAVAEVAETTEVTDVADEQPHTVLDLRDGQVLPEMTVEQFEAFMHAAHGVPAHPDSGPAYGHGYGSRLVIDLTERPSTIDLRA